MNPCIPKPAGQKATPDVTNPVEALAPEMDSVAMLKAIQEPGLTLPPVKGKSLEVRPTSHWGLNE